VESRILKANNETLRHDFSVVDRLLLRQLYSGNFRSIRRGATCRQLYWYFNDNLHLHLGYGIDSPSSRDLGANQILSNQTAFSTLVWAVSPLLQLSFEVDYRKTKYNSAVDADGFTFAFESLWQF
jgi:hypothetical protein